MKHRFAIVIFLLCATSVIGLAQTPPKPSSPRDQSLITAEKTFIAATKKHEADYFKRTLADDYYFVGYDGQLHDRQEVLGEHSSDSWDLMAYNMKVIDVGENAAIVTYDVVLQVPPSEDQGPPPRYQHWSSVWTRQGDQWKLKFQQSTPTHWGDW